MTIHFKSSFNACIRLLNGLINKILRKFDHTTFSFSLFLSFNQCLRNERNVFSRDPIKHFKTKTRLRRRCLPKIWLHLKYFYKTNQNGLRRLQAEYICYRFLLPYSACIGMYGTFLWLEVGFNDYG